MSRWKKKRRIKFILCRPLGGLNDVLCQVAFSRALGVALGRKVVIQSETASVAPSHRFGHKFEDIFLSTDDTLDCDPRALWEHDYKDFDKRIQDLAPRIGVDKFAESSVSKLTSGKAHESRLSLLESLKQTRTPILVHESWGGGLRSATALKYLTLVPRLTSLIPSLRAAVSGHSVGFHFRNSDLRSDFSFLEKELLSVPVDCSVLVATDDSDLLERIRSTLPGRKIVSASEILESLSRSLTDTERAVLEMVMLSFCENLVLIPIERPKDNYHAKVVSQPRYSGFGRLSKHVWAVSRAKSNGVFSLIRNPKTLTGLAAFGNPVPNLMFLLLFEIPRILWHAKMANGFYAQIDTL